ncbi:regulator of nonsense transcripts 2 isoform X2 [Ischnura elegans]|nr:regulator of nonsense transcripts 2 isoform X2 [Ischnura elegans]
MMAQKSDGMGLKKNRNLKKETESTSTPIQSSLGDGDEQEPGVGGTTNSDHQNGYGSNVNCKTSIGSDDKNDAFIANGSKEDISMSCDLSEESEERPVEDKALLTAYIYDATSRLQEKTALRQKNQPGAFTRPDEKHLRNLDSSLKKNTAFVRKMKTFSASQADSLVKDMAALNLSKYISEIAAALVESKLKMTDIPAAVSICCLLHRTYAEFSGFLLENWHKALAVKKDEPISNPSKLRVDIRFYADLVNAGIFSFREGLALLGSVLTALIQGDKEEHKNINIILSFCKHCGEDYAGLVPRRIRQLSEEYNMPLPKSDLLSPEKTKNVRQLLKDYYASLCRHLIKEHNELQAFERQNKRILQTKGELSGERRERLDTLQSSFEKLLTNTISFADILDEDIPELSLSEPLKHDDEAALKAGAEVEEFPVGMALWDDEESKKFYESIPDLRSILPGLFPKDSTPTAEPKETECEPDTKQSEEIKSVDSSEALITFNSGSPVEELDEHDSAANGSAKVVMDSFLTHLLNCINVEKIDNAAVEFGLNLNTKYNRRKLVKALFAVPRTRFDLLPYYARMVAILNPCMPDIASELNFMLLQDFKYHVKKKDQINIESKVKVIRFIGELVNFSVLSKVDALHCLKVLLQDFTHHFIEMACNLLETCGRFLYRSQDSHQRTKIYLEQMMRKKAVLTLESRYVTMIENAYYHILPPEVSVTQKKKEKPVKLAYIDKLLYQDLAKPTTDKVLRQMRKLNWDDNEVSLYAIKCLTQIWKYKYFNIRCVANMVSGLVGHLEGIGVQVVDAVLEDIRMCMEIGHPKYNQRRIAMIMYLGELYNYRMVESGDIFKVLYSLITFGVGRDHQTPSPLDPPENLFRIRLVCVLLETCGTYFSHGSSKKKLDCFFVYFQNYFWYKYSHPFWNVNNPFPFGVMFMFKDVLTSLRPKIKLYESYGEAQYELMALESDLRLRLTEVAPELISQDELDDAVHTDAVDPDAADEQEEQEGSSVTNSNRERSPMLNTISELEEDNDEDEDMYGIPDINFFGTPGEEVSNSQISPQVLTSASLNSLEDHSNENVGVADEERAVPAGPKLLECAENDDFMTAFDKMLTENIQDRMREIVKPQQIDISVPLHVRGNLKKTYEQLMEPEEDKSTVTFVLMVRKGNKQLYKNLDVPFDSQLAMNLKNREEAEREEKEKVKRLTLDINERLEEEDYLEMIAQAQRPAVVNLNRERKQKYQHPKGAPDADLIFGPKKATR